MNTSRIILGIDPGLRHTGWGLISQKGNHLGFIAAGRINPPVDLEISMRLLCLAEGIRDVITKHHPTEAAIEETFFKNNARSALLLGQARGSAMLTLAQNGLPPAEYAATRIKQSVTGNGMAEKKQVQAMIAILLPGSAKLASDAADALAVAVTHAHHIPVSC